MSEKVNQLISYMWEYFCNIIENQLFQSQEFWSYSILLVILCSSMMCFQSLLGFKQNSFISLFPEKMIQFIRYLVVFTLFQLGSADYGHQVKLGTIKFVNLSVKHSWKVKTRQLLKYFNVCQVSSSQGAIKVL